MFSVRIRGGPVPALMVILVLMFVAGCATATESSVNISQRAIIMNDVIENDIIEQIVFNSALIDGSAVNTKQGSSCYLCYRTENVVFASDSVGIVSTSLNINRSGNPGTTNNTTIALTAFFTYTTTPRGALMPGDNSVVQKCAANTASNMQGLGDSVGIFVVDHDINVIHKI